MNRKEELKKRFEKEMDEIKSDAKRRICKLVRTYDEIDESGEILNSVMDELQANHGRVKL